MFDNVKNRPLPLKQTAIQDFACYIAVYHPVVDI